MLFNRFVSIQKIEGKCCTNSVEYTWTSHKPIILSTHVINYVYFSYSCMINLFHFSLFQYYRQCLCIQFILGLYVKILFCELIFLYGDGSKSWQFSQGKLIYKHIITKPRHNLLSVKSWLFDFSGKFSIISR